MYDETLVFNNATFLDYCHTKYSSYKYCYTDGSKGNAMGPYVGSAVYFQWNRQVEAYRLHPQHSILFSEFLLLSKLWNMLREITLVTV